MVRSLSQMQTERPMIWPRRTCETDQYSTLCSDSDFTVNVVLPSMFM